MVLRKGDSRVVKDVRNFLDQHPKRSTKVHAQRKFAQGSGMISPMITPVKEKEKAKVNGTASPSELLPAKRPRADDFLTFLCFRGTKALPSRLDFFNTASKPDKTEKESPGSSKRSPITQDKPKMNKNKIQNNPKGRALLNKMQEQRLTQSRIDLKHKGKALRSRALIEGRQKIVATKVSKTQITRVKRGHPLLLKRIGATRMRSGLRSAGELPPGSEVGIKTDRKPRSDLKNKSKGTIGRPTKKVIAKAAVKKGKNKEGDKKLEEEEDQSDENESGKEEEPKKNFRKSTRAVALSAKSSPKNVKTRPTRKTKEAATLYMEMLHKDFRGNEEDDFEDEDEFESIEEKPDDDKNENSNKSKQKIAGKDKKPQINRVIHPHKSILKRLGTTRMRSGLRSAGSASASDTVVKPKRKSAKNIKQSVKKQDEDTGNESEESSTSETNAKDKKQKTPQQTKGKIKKEIKEESVESDNESNQPSASKKQPPKQSGKGVKQGNKKLIVKNDTESEETTQKSDTEEKKSKPTTKAAGKQTRASRASKKQDLSSESESEEIHNKKSAKPGRKGRQFFTKSPKLSQDIKNEVKSEESASESEVEIKTERKRAPRYKDNKRRDLSSSDSEFHIDDSDHEERMPVRMSTRTRHPTVGTASKLSDVRKRPSRKTKEAATLYMEMLTKDLRSPDEEEFEEFDFEDMIDVKQEDLDEDGNLKIKGGKTEGTKTKSKAGRASKSPESLLKGKLQERASRTSRVKRNMGESSDSKSSSEEEIPDFEMIDAECNSKKSLNNEADSETKVVKTPAKRGRKAKQDKKLQEEELEISKNSGEDEADISNESSKKVKTSITKTNKSKITPIKKEENLDSKSDSFQLKKTIQGKKDSVPKQASEKEIDPKEYQGKLKDENKITDSEDNISEESNKNSDNEAPKPQVKNLPGRKNKKNELTKPVNSKRPNETKIPDIQKRQKFLEEDPESDVSRLSEEEKVDEIEEEEERRRRPKRPKLTARDPDDKPYFDSEHDANRIPFRRRVINNASNIPKTDNKIQEPLRRKSNSSCTPIKNKQEPKHGDAFVIDEPTSSTHCKLIPNNSDDSDVIEALISLRNEQFIVNTSQSNDVLTISPTAEIRKNDGSVLDLKLKLNSSDIKADFSEDFGFKEQALIKERKLSTDSAISQSSSIAECHDKLKKDKKKQSLEEPSNIVKREDESANQRGRTFGKNSFSSLKKPEHESKTVRYKPNTPQGEIKDPFKVTDKSKVKPLSVEIFNDMSDLNSDSEVTNILSSNSKSKDCFTESEDSKQSTLTDLKVDESKFAYFKNELKEASQDAKPEDKKIKQSVNDTWRQAFKNARIPKPGQRSPAPHSVEPFVRKLSPFIKNEEPKKNLTNTTAKLPNIQSFKNFSKFGSNSPSRPFPGDVFEGKGNIYLSPNRVMYPREDAHKDSPTKSSSSSIEEPKDKKIDIPPVKTLTQLQYEKRSSELISGLGAPPSLLLDAKSIYLPNLSSNIRERKQESPMKTVAVQKPKTEGKHLNLPLAVEHTLRKMSPTTVSKKPTPARPIVEKKFIIPQVAKLVVPEENVKPMPRPLPAPESSNRCTSSTIEHLHKKKVNMSTEEIRRWLNDSSSCRVEHVKDCGIFENNQCACSFRTSSESMQNSRMIAKEEAKVDHGVVEPPIQLKELDSDSKMFEAETISTCKVDEYREQIMKKTKEKPEPLSLPSTPLNMTKGNQFSPDKKIFKSDRSMTEEEMCEFDFRFERNSNSPRESGSEMSSPTPRDDFAAMDDKGEGVQAEKKPIFQQRRSGSASKQSSLSKSPSAFSAENESSVYAFEPDLPPPTLSKPFRRRGSRVKSSDEESPASSSIAVQVNLENEAVLECSTQTDENEGQLFYLPLGGDRVQEQVIQGVTVKLHSDGPEQRVIMRAELVTKPSNMVPQPSTSRASDLPSRVQKPEQKVRPLSSISTSTSTKPLIGTVQPTVRNPDGKTIQYSDQGTLTKQDKANQGTQSSPGIDKSNDDKEESLPTRSKSVKNRTLSININSSEFPIPGTTPCMLEAPVFRPTEKEFQDPLEYIEQITPLAQSFGICRIIPPSNFKPECKVSDDMRFTAYNQFVHKMLNRWGPNVREMSAIKKYLATQSITLNQVPWVGGIEIDLPRLYLTVQNCGGLKEVIEKKRWTKVADLMKIPKSAQDRVTKLDDIYCKYLLPYDTLSQAERNKLLNEVEIEWEARERRILEEKEDEKDETERDQDDQSDSESDSDDRDECIAKGRSMALSQFFRIARNTMAMWFKETNPTAKEVETEFWKHVSTGINHLCVHSGSIDSGTWGYGFPTAKTSSTSRHPWNLKVLTNNSGSILRSLGPAMGVTVPTLHVGMLFTACCWYRDPHSLPWIEYLHTGASKIWYGVPDSWCEELRGAMKNLLPRFCRDKKIWLASDTAMVPPELLVQQGVSLCRTVQEPGQFILVFPKAFTSTVCTGYLVSESVYFAQPSWLNTARLVFKDIQESCEPPIFSLEKLLFNIASDIRSSADVLIQVLPMVVDLRENEVIRRKELLSLGLTDTEKLPIAKGRKKSQEEAQEYECEICRAILFLSLVSNSQDDCNYCLAHAIETIQKDSSILKHSKLMYTYNEEQMEELIEKVKTRIEVKSQKKQGKNNSTNK